MKRIRKYPECPNPLFEKWIEEWRKEAMERDSPLQHLFGKALDSLKKYPLPLSSGKDCYILRYFGQKLCAMLDKKLARYDRSQKVLSTSVRSDLPSNNGIQKESNGSIKKKTPDTTYIPKIGSSSYAILITMYKNRKAPNNLDFMYKKDIISQAQSECNHSMKNTAFRRYSGWSCMSLLITKELVSKKSNPAKYSLTDAGVALAMSLVEAKNALSSDCSDAEIGSNLKNDQNFRKNSITPPSKESDSKSSEKSFDDLKYFEKSQSDLSHPVKSFSPSKSNPSTNKIDIIMIDDDDDDDDDDDNNKVLECNTLQKSDEKLIRKEFDVEPTKAIDDSFHVFCKDNAESLITEVQSAYNIKRKKTDETKKKKEKYTEGVITASQNKIETHIEDTSTESFYLLPNNFDIILLVDTQETSGGKIKPSDDVKTSELSKMGILFEVRSLKVGDFTWIAKCRFTNRELVLPYIVERKRMDDFGSSIRDGRYHEQKFRLIQSGVKNIIYMIESYGKNYHASIPITSLFQAAMNSLVQDNFIVKFTSDHKNSMRYLATITTMLTEMYENKELISCKKNDLPTINTNISGGLELLMEFGEFNKSAVKTKNFSVREMFLRQLLQLKGLSVEKATAIVELYPSPKCLAQALRDTDENLLANIVSGPTKRKIGPVLSKTLYQLYTQRNFN